MCAETKFANAIVSGGVRVWFVDGLDVCSGAKSEVAKTSVACSDTGADIRSRQ
jgi:hypothetical protein